MSGSDSSTPSALRTAAPTIARGVDGLGSLARFLRRRPRWSIAFGIILLGCGTLWATNYYSPQSRALRRVEQLGGYAGGPTALEGMFRGRSPTFLTRLLRRLPSKMTVTGLVVEGKPAADADVAVFVAAFPQIEQLDVSSTHITDESLQHVGTLPSLWRFLARHTAVTDAGVAAIATAPQLSHIELDGTQITDAGLAEVAKLPRLWSLSVSQTQITDAGLVHLHGKTIDSLILSDTLITDAGVAAFQAASPKCRVIR